MYQFRDPIHGFIEVSEQELKIINSAPFQRLRNIRQLATIYLVYHGAEHTRFGHSLGVMHLTSRVFDSIVQKNPLLFSDDVEQLILVLHFIFDHRHPLVIDCLPVNIFVIVVLCA